MFLNCNNYRGISFPNIIIIIIIMIIIKIIIIKYMHSNYSDQSVQSDERSLITYRLLRYTSLSESSLCMYLVLSKMMKLEVRS